MKIWSYLIVLIIGLVVGALGVYFAPEYVGPFLPKSLQSKGVEIEGEVVAKQRKGNTLLMTLNTKEGAILITFRKKVPEIDLLVNKGDRIEVRLKSYSPFVDDPAIKRVRKDSVQGGVQYKEESSANEETISKEQSKDELSSEQPKSNQENEIKQEGAVQGEDTGRDATTD